MADIALAGRVIASHYAEPLSCAVATEAVLHSAPSAQSDAVVTVAATESFLMLDESLGWAWGYAGSKRRVGYLRSDTLAP